MVLSLALARIRFAVWFTSAKLDVPQPFEFGSMPPVAADSMRSPDEYLSHTVVAAHPYAPEPSDEEPTWEDAEWQ